MKLLPVVFGSGATPEDIALLRKTYKKNRKM
jgi:hypothetical protein